MNPENRNMILAIALSMSVLFGWQVFVVGPELEKEAGAPAGDCRNAGRGSRWRNGE